MRLTLRPLIRRLALFALPTIALVPSVSIFAGPLPGPDEILRIAQVRQPQATGGSLGFDISWPQCPDDRPMDVPGFAIIGVTGGKAFTQNDCLAVQYKWASRSRVAAQVYTNLNGVPIGYWDNHCQPTDAACNAFHYGYNSAAQAVAYARSQKADPKNWWLDIETMNAWSDNHFLNERVIAGAVEYLQAIGKDVGVYSTPFQWGEIAGGYAPNLPVWTAGAEDLADAQTRCTPQYAFGGGQVKYVQYIDGKFDVNFVC